MLVAGWLAIPLVCAPGLLPYPRVQSRTPTTAPAMARSSSSCHFYFRPRSQSPPSFLHARDNAYTHPLAHTRVHTYFMRTLATTIHPYCTNRILLLKHCANRVSRRQPRPLVSPACCNRLIAWLAVQAGGTARRNRKYRRNQPCRAPNTNAATAASTVLPRRLQHAVNPTASLCYLPSPQASGADADAMTATTHDARPSANH